MAGETRELRIRQALGALEGLIRAGEDLLGEAQRNAPVEEGTLRASGALVVIVNGSRYEGAGAKAVAQAAVRAAVGVGGPLSIDVEVSFNTPYAARQHEVIGYRHPKGGTAKYLERPFAARVSRYEQIVAAAARL